MDNKLIINLLKTVVEESHKEEVLYRMPRAVGGFSEVTKTVVDGDKLKLGVETIITMLENVEEREG